MSRYFKNKKSGFTLIELLVCMIIILVLFTVILFNQSKYDDTASVTRAADELGLNISQYQNYGIGVRELTPGSADFAGSYGITVSLLAQGSNVSYLAFADRNKNGAYDGDWTCATGGANECLQKFDIPNGNIISLICLSKASTPNPSCIEAQRVDIVFNRPNIQANMKYYNNGGNVFSPSADTKGAFIVLKSPNNVYKAVLLYNTGQISVP